MTIQHLVFTLGIMILHLRTHTHGTPIDQALVFLDRQLATFISSSIHACLKVQPVGKVRYLNFPHLLMQMLQQT